jgi:transketolase
MNVNFVDRVDDPPEAVLPRGREISAEDLRRRADWIRLETIRLIEQAGEGHYTSVFSSAEIFAVLYYQVLRLAPGAPAWPDRDRFLLGKGHAATGLWPVLADLGFFPREWLDQFGSLGSPLTDHPDMRAVPGVDFSSGSLGHNLSVGVGISLAGRVQGRDYRTFVLTGDGELHEGQVWEAAMAASHYGLGNLVAIIDANQYSASQQTSSAMGIEPLAARFTAFGWRTTEVADGHDVVALTESFRHLPPTGSNQPTCVIARTRKGKGVAGMEAEPQHFHYGSLTAEQQVEAVREILARRGQ